MNGNTLLHSTQQVVSFAPAVLRKFLASPTLVGFLEVLEDCWGNEVALAQAKEAWERLSSRISEEGALDEFWKFLSRTTFVAPADESTIVDEAREVPEDSKLVPEFQERLQALAELFAKTADMLPHDHPCYYFPAAAPLQAAFHEALGEHNPIPVISEHLRAVFAEADEKPGSTQVKKAVLTPAGALLLGQLCKWVAGTCSNRQSDAIEVWLRLLCNGPATFQGDPVDVHDVDTLMLALELPSEMLGSAIDKWSDGLDYEKDDRLIEGIRVLTRLSLTDTTWPDEDLMERLVDAGIESADHLIATLPARVLHLITAVLYCRWSVAKPCCDDVAEQLPRLFRELSELGALSDGASPLQSDVAHDMSLSLRELNDEDVIGDLAQDECEFIILGRAVNRHSGWLDTEYFGVDAYGPSGENISARFEEYRLFAAAARKLGLQRLAAAAISFFLITQSAKLQGKLTADWPALSDELNRALQSPAKKMAAMAIGIAAEFAERHGNTLNSIRLRDLVAELPEESPVADRENIVRLIPPLARSTTEADIARQIGVDGWDRLGDEARSHLVDGWIQARRTRPNPVNSDQLHWGSQVLPFTLAVEAALRSRMGQLLDHPDLALLYRHLGPDHRLPSNWTFGALVDLLARYESFSDGLRQAAAQCGLGRLCRNHGLLSELRGVVGFRNRAAHPDGLPLSEDEFQTLLVNFFSRGFLREFADALDSLEAL